VLRTDYGKYEEEIKIIITSRDSKLRMKPEHTIERKESIGKWFDKNGVFYPDQFAPFLKSALREFESLGTKKSS
jgi:hypothetical protein